MGCIIVYKKIIKFSLCIMILFILIFSKIENKISATSSDGLVKYAKSAVLIEVESGEVLYEYNAHARLEPASMTKIMTMKLVMDAIKSKRITKDQILTTSEVASSMGGTQIYLSVGEKMCVEDLFKSMIITSANDATVSLCEAISGSIDNFVVSMNKEVRRLGLKNTSFRNVTGLPITKHYSSSYDMAMIARSLLLEYEEDIIPYTSKYEDYVREDSDDPFWLVNTNKMIKHIDGVDGLKTGWTESAGYCLTCTKKENGMRLISVVMNVDSVKHRTEDTLSLLNYGFSNYEKMIIVGKNTEIEDGNNILLDPTSYKVVTSNNIVKVIKKGSKLDPPKLEVSLYNDRIMDLKQYNVGKLDVYINNELVGSTKLELVEKPKKTTFWKVFLNVLREIF